MDDVIGATSLPLDSPQEFINYTNSFHPALQFTHNITEDSLPFLDLLLTIKDDTISTTIYYTETDAHSLLDYVSSHPKNAKIQSLILSYAVSVAFVLPKKISMPKQKEMSSFFHQNNYPETVTDSALGRVKQLLQEDALLPVDRSQTNSCIPFTLTSHPLNNGIKNVIYNNFQILRDDSHTKGIFEAPSLMAFRRDKNIKDTLVRTNHKTNDPPDTFPCNHHLCQTCTHINNSTTVTNGNRNFTIRFALCASSCASSSVVYCITCTKCSILERRQDK